MSTYQRSVRVAAPLERVWEFHSTENGLKALTPDWMGMTVKSVTGPDGEPNPTVLEAGSVLEIAVQPFEIGPPRQWTSEITARERGDGSAYFTDIMTDGPFSEWEHTHLFYADGDETILTDTIEYELPLGPVRGVAGHLAVVGFEPMFRYRHRQTKKLLE